EGRRTEAFDGQRSDRRRLEAERGSWSARWRGPERGGARRQRRLRLGFFSLRRGLIFGAATGTQGGGDLVAAAARQQEDEERVGVELLAQQVEDRRHVFAGVRPVGAGAGGGHVALGAGEERRARGGEGVLDLGRHLPAQQLRRVDRLGGHRVVHPLP